MAEFPIGSAHGRFQPFHNEHLDYVLAAQERCEFLWIGITRYDIADLSPLGRDRDKPESNPLTYFERVEIISAALLDAGVCRGVFGFIPFPIENVDRLPQFLPISVPCFTTICDDWNRKKIAVLEAHGYQVKVLRERAQKCVTGHQIRQDLLEGRQSWRAQVPRATAAFIDRVNLAERLRAIRARS